MGIGIECQAEMAEIFLFVDSHRHAAQQNHLYQMGIIPLPDYFDQRGIISRTRFIAACQR